MFIYPKKQNSIAIILYSIHLPIYIGRIRMEWYFRKLDYVNKQYKLNMTRVYKLHN